MAVGTVLVTGGGGYIGSVLTEMLLDQGYRVVVLDRFFFGPTLDRLSRPTLQIVRGDIRWVHPEVFADVDAVCDLAALSGDSVGELDPVVTMAINASGRARVARFARDLGVRRYVLASSCSVYGAQKATVDEASAVNPLSTYAKANLDAERAVLSLNAEAFSVTALRQATVYGLSPRMRFDLVVNAMTLSLLQSGEIHVQRDGRQWRPLVHVRDTARAFIKVLEAERNLVGGQTFNVGSDEQNVQILSLGKRVAKATDVPFHYTWYGDDDRRSYRVRFKKIRTALGYSPLYHPEDGVREIAKALRDRRIAPDPRTRTVEWYRNLLTWHQILDDIAIDGRLL